MSIEKLTKMTRTDEARLQKMKELFPEAFCDGKLNLEVLEEEINGIDNKIIDGNTEETYGFQWNGKKEARRLAFIPSEGTLSFNKGEGVDEENTNNIVVKGDNLDVLRVLQKSYAGKIKLIYIDPPYNTGSDFVYKDDFKEPIEKYLLKSGQADEEGLLTSNPKSSGRFHADWLNMMYPRLKLARNLLKDDGVIFVSIDDNEQANLKKIMDEIFGEENFVTSIVWQKKYSPQNDATYFSDMHDFILVYAKKKKQSKVDTGWERNLLPRTESQNSKYKNPDNDSRGSWKSVDFSVKTYSKQYDYSITTPSGRVVYPPSGRCWSTSQENFKKLVEDNRVWFGKDGNNVPSLKRFLTEVQDGTVPVTWWSREECGDNQEATQELRKLFSDTGVPFETPKPVRLLKRILQLSTSTTENDIVLDFFAGSGTTAQAVLELNKEDKGNRQFIMVQIPDKIDNEYYSNITELTKERIKRIIKQLNESDNNIHNLDRGFTVYTLNKSYIKNWNGYKGDSLKELEETLDLFKNAHFREGWTDKDVIVELMLNQGFPLDSIIRKLEDVNDNDLWIINHKDIPFNMYVCLNEKLDNSTVDYLVRKSAHNMFICIDDALTNKAKLILSETMKVKTI
ncbi:site-specific DNA-methyltransferase [Priestia megaterium]|uniref:site-specific DNA-methyltransferase n=1 Tax=Priestia megaterium TaxID=1404 RepID=UPI0011BBEF1E|nr:site-specific DNA-methyltransferase [Priestia megaterium]QDZ80158.1 site-specific DNA-methyltransferase [Priestia megaterium]